MQQRNVSEVAPTIKFFNHPHLLRRPSFSLNETPATFPLPRPVQNVFQVSRVDKESGGNTISIWNLLPSRRIACYNILTNYKGEEKLSSLELLKYALRTIC